MISSAVVALRSYAVDSTSDVSREEIQREIDITAALDCPFIVPCFDHFVDAGRWWLVQEHCAGGTLKQTLENYHADIPEEWAASQVSI